MATKFTCRNTAESVGITPSASTDWEDTSLLARARARATGSTIASLSLTDAITTVSFNDANAADRDVLYRQYVSLPLTAGQTVTGSQAIKAQCRSSETTISNNMFFSVGIRIIASDGSTVRKTMLAVTRDAVEAAASLTNRQFTATSAATNYTTVAGDRVVIEIGMSGDPAGSNEHDSSMSLGDNAASDLAEDDTTTTANNPWVSLNDTLTFVSPTFDQSDFRGRYDNGSETTATWKAPTNTNWSQAPGVDFRLRFHVAETASSEGNITWALKYSKNGGAWTAVDDVVVSATNSANITNNGDTTQQIGSGTFVTDNNAIDTNNGTTGQGWIGPLQHTEIEFAIKLVGSGVADGDTVQFKVTSDSTSDGGAADLATYTNTPTVTVAEILVDATSNSTYQTLQSSYSWSHTCTGSNRYLLVGVSMLSVVGSSVSSITYNNVALTRITTIASATGAIRAEIWGLIAPATGSNTIAVTLSTGLDSASGAVSFTGVNQITAIETPNTASATNGVGAADATVNITPITDNCLIADTVATSDTAITVGAGQTSRWNVTGTLGSGAGSTEGQTSPIAVTMSWTNVAGLATWSIAGVAIRSAQMPEATEELHSMNRNVSIPIRIG